MKAKPTFCYNQISQSLYFLAAHLSHVYKRCVFLAHPFIVSSVYSRPKARVAASSFLLSQLWEMCVSTHTLPPCVFTLIWTAVSLFAVS